ncbi:kinase-like domain-containing protein [Hyaloraphidium curvatum]|nr:kinase-like domain-containing protein [Hyaloraphidium curvatum]
MKDCLTKALAAREKRLLKDRKTLLLVNASEITFDRTKPPFAEGNFGEVYVGKLFGTTDVAIKVVRPRRTIDVDPAELLEMVQHEANVWERVGNHPNVLPLMAFCLEPQPMLISNLIKNGNLRSYLERHGWDLSKGLKLLQDVAKGMSALQKQGVVHSDLKPANILVDHGGAALVADFGLSRITATAGGDEVRGGTPGYIAPELYVAGTAPHGASDVFAFAMVAFEVASRGAKPLPHGTWSNSDIAAFLTGGGRPTRPYGIGDDIWALIQRCWAQDPLERPSFEDIVQELDRIRGPAANDDADDGAAGTPIDAGSRPTSSYSRTKSIRVSGRGSK